jgi:predicted 3-demethylubiquinone-9 3-methyltransferase (glyoxalase superfamily)
MKVTQCLWFEKDMDAALSLYTSLIPGSSLDWGSALAADSPSGPADSVKIAGFTLGDQRYMAFQAAGRPGAFNHCISITIECDTQGEIDHLWEALGKDGQYEQCGWLRDRWGLAWQIVPKRLSELTRSPDKAVAKRVTEAMLKMVKIEIAGLEAAAKG